MVGIRRFVIVGVVLSLALSTPAAADEALETLWKDYQAYGLPVPPAGAELAHLPGPEVRISNGVREQDVYLVLLVKKARGKEDAVYWFGCEAGRQWRGIEFKLVPPKAASLSGTLPATMQLGSGRNGFPTYPDLALAVQCRGLGWGDAAAALLERSGRRPKY